MKNFIKSWGPLILIFVLMIASRIFIWDVVTVDGNSMDPNLGNGQRLIISKISNVNRFDIVVAQETTEQTQLNDPSSTSGKKIVKRVIGMPGDTVSYHNDNLSINGRHYDEKFISDYQNLFDNKKLAARYASLPLNSSLSEAQRNYFVQLANTNKAFTVDSTGNPDFTMKVPQGEYLLLGDDRVVSADSRKVGTFKRSQIIGKVVFRFLPFGKFGPVH